MYFRERVSCNRFNIFFFCGKLEVFVNGSFLKIFVSLNIMNKEGRTDFRNNARFGIEIQIPISDYD